MIIPVDRERLRPKKSTRKKAQMRAETNFTTPKMAVAKSFSEEPVVPRIWKNWGAYIVIEFAPDHSEDMLV